MDTTYFHVGWGAACRFPNLLGCGTPFPGTVSRWVHVLWSTASASVWDLHTDVSSAQHPSLRTEVNLPDTFVIDSSSSSTSVLLPSVTVTMLTFCQMESHHAGRFPPTH